MMQDISIDSNVSMTGNERIAAEYDMMSNKLVEYT
jgi:hypothetical protein